MKPTLNTKMASLIKTASITKGGSKKRREAKLKGIGAEEEAILDADDSE